jgi:hypothetical protein
VSKPLRPPSVAILDQPGRVALDLACCKCGRNLRGLLPTDECPQCGLSAAQSLETTLDAEGRVRVDVACLKCGYNLRSLALDGKCPECALPVARSVRGDLLEFADPTWVKRLASGATLLLAGGVSAIPAILCGFLAGLLFDLQREGIGALFGAGALMIAVGGAVLVPLAALAGIEMLTALEPRIRFRREGLSARRVCRYGLAAGVALVAVGVLVVALEGRIVPAWHGAALLTATLIVVFGALPVSLLRHLGALFRRVPDSDHANMACGLSIGILVGDGIVAIPFVTSLFIPLVGDLVFIAFIGLFILAGCGLGLLGTLYYARTDFANAAERAGTRAGITAAPETSGIAEMGQTANNPPEN